MIKIDMWYGHDHKEADKIDIFFMPTRGNILEISTRTEKLSVIMCAPIL